MDTNENKLAEQKKCSIPKIWGVIAIFIGIAALVLVLLVSQKGEETIVSSSSLKKAVNISELSTGEIEKLKEVCDNRILKVIIETCLLSEEEKIKM